MSCFEKYLENILEEFLFICLFVFHLKQTNIFLIKPPQLLWDELSPFW